MGFALGEVGDGMLGRGPLGVLLGMASRPPVKTETSELSVPWPLKD